MSENTDATNSNNPGQSTAAVKTQKSESGEPSARVSAVSSVIKTVSNADELYKEVDDSANAGATIVLQRGIYQLTPTDSNNQTRLNGGRLDLQPDMKLVGVDGDPSAVTIDTRLIPWQSLRVDPTDILSNKLGSIRVGLGNNAVEWLTIEGNYDSGAGIATDHPGTSPIQLRVANVICVDNSTTDPAKQFQTRGVDIRNLDPSMANRKIDVIIENCEFSGGMQGIRFANFPGADGGEIYAVMNNVTSFKNKAGCFMANNRTASAIIDVHSNNDHFVDNVAGCVIIGGIVTTQTSSFLTSDGNYTGFTATASHFENNMLQVQAPDKGGIVTVGGEAPNNPRKASFNNVKIRLKDCIISNNQVHDFAAFGARNNAQTDIAGTYNTVVIELEGTVQYPTVERRISLPDEPPKPTNKVIVNGPVKTDFSI